ncbi:MAG: DUF3109 domain-containing protein [Ignavibacteria bacterium]
MFVIGEAVVDNAVAHASFCCDLERCKGACCTLEGGRGAPLEDDELLEIEKAYPIVKRYLDDTHIQTIESKGFYEGSPGDYTTMCVEHGACVFVFRENGIAHCSFEKAYLNGETEWRKPISCHLFPLRVRRRGRDFLRYDVIDECAAGRQRGEQEQIALSVFLREALTRKYGRAWYEQFKRMCERVRTGVTSAGG